MEMVKVTMDTISIWVSLPNLPFNFWNKEALSTICSVLGKPLFSNRYTMKERLSYSRVCVEIDARRVLKDSFTILLEDGSSFVQKVIYDWKPPRCED